MIPQEKTDAVTRGLRETFGATGIDDISRITRGHTASLVFRIIVHGSPYLLKIITRNEDPTRHYTSMRAAAEAGLAPAVHYTDIEERISITGFIDAHPLSQSEALVRLPALLRNLHALPPFNQAPFNTTCTFLLNPSPALDGFLQKFQSAAIPRSEREELLAIYAELAASYSHDEAEMVASHNDLFKPDNILYDGQQLFLVDWEAAFHNDRYADLAVAAHHAVTNEEQESTYLHEYFGAPPTRYQSARFHLMQQLAHVFYTMGFLYLVSSDNPVDWSQEVPEFSDCHRRMWAGEIDLAVKDVKTLYGRVHWKRLLHNIRQPRYRESLRIVSDHRANR